MEERWSTDNSWIARLVVQCKDSRMLLSRLWGARDTGHPKARDIQDSAPDGLGGLRVVLRERCDTGD